jgi:hypothetical protein
MKIKHGPVSKRTPVYEVQVLYLVKAIRKLEEVCLREFRAETELSLKDFNLFREMPEYECFIEAAFVCGFVCTDYSRFFPLENVHARPNEIIPALTFSKLRHYVHALQRAEKWNSEYSTTLWTSVMSGALSLVARRLESDQSLYESDNSPVDDEI